MGQRLVADSIKDPVKTVSTVTLPGLNIITIGGQQYVLNSPVMNAASTGLGGLDAGALIANASYGLFAAAIGASAGLTASLDSAPLGFAKYTLIGNITTDGSAEIFVAGLTGVSDRNPVGMIIQSRLTEAQFQSQNGIGWVLMDGRNVAGSLYAQITGINVLDDARGLVLRGKNNGRSDGNQNPDGDLALGAFQNQNFASHGHTQAQHRHTESLSDGIAEANVASLFRSGWVNTANPVVGYGGIFNTSNGRRGLTTYQTPVINDNGGNETRMRNLTVNTFIKINP